MMCAVSTYVYINLSIYLPFQLFGVHNSKITFSAYLFITYTTCMMYFIYHVRNLRVIFFIFERTEGCLDAKIRNVYYMSMNMLLHKTFELEDGI